MSLNEKLWDRLGKKPEGDFTTDLSLCFKWLVPKAIDEIMAEHKCSSDIAYAILFKKWLQELEINIPEHAPTLCSVIEKLIDGGNDGNLGNPVK